jgi:hypothetical protein
VRGKGHALRYAIDQLLASGEPRAVVIVAADTTADPDLVAALVGVHNTGRDAVQGQSILVGDGSAGSELRAAAFVLVNRVRPAGGAVLGLPCSLQGTGMLLSRRLLERYPWDAFSSAEDLEYATRLREAGATASVHERGASLLAGRAEP